MKFRITSLSALLLIASLFACSPIKEDQSGVTIVENTASIYGHVVLSNGSTLVRKGHSVSGLFDSITVYLLHETEAGFEVDSTSVNTRTAFRFDGLDSGIYILQAKFPNGDLLTKTDIRLAEGQSLNVDLNQKGSRIETDSMVVWEVDITCGDTAHQAVLYGPGDQAGGIQIRMLEQPMQYYSGLFTMQVSRGTKIAIRFPRRLLQRTPEIEIRTGIAAWEGYNRDLETMANGGNHDLLYPQIDTIPNRRMRISWNGNGPNCSMIDGTGIPPVSCTAYTSPRLSTLADIQSGMGSVFRDLVNEFGVTDSVAGYLFIDKVERGKVRWLFDLWAAKQLFDSLAEGANISNLPTDLDKAFFDSIPREVFEGLNADTLLPPLKIGGQLNHTGYWNQVPGVFYDEFVTYYTTHHVPFDSSLSRYEELMQFPNFAASLYGILHRYEDYALVSLASGCSGYGQLLLRQNADGVYKLIKQWVTDSHLTCD